MGSLRVCLFLLLPVVTSALPVTLGGNSEQQGAPGQFWHISDLHLDFSYHLTDDHTKVCLSSKGVNASNPGIYGDFMCDAPYGLILSAIQFIKDSKQKVEFMIWTGDSPPHVPVNELSTKMVIEVIRNMTSTIRNLLPDMLVFPALGNHDYWPQDQFPVSGSEIYTSVAEIWKPWLSEDALCTFRKGGYYSQIYKSNKSSHSLRIISLNTNLYYGPNKVTVNITDPADQFAWLEETLQYSRQKNEKFYGHTHRDSIMILLDEKEKPVGSVFVAPAVTPIKSLSETDANNPGFRLYQYDTNSYDMLDLWHYYLNLTEANLRKQAPWMLEYIMTKEYNIKDLKPESLEELVKRFQMPKSTDYQNYYKNYIVSYDNSDGCEGLCKGQQICAIQHVDAARYFNCIIHFLKLHNIVTENEVLRR
ncbi:acid sphingomyelinase-like phosphodiesterase 3a isoform X2 [Pseudophryne corroboree]|uniref:acid sphingomyelinase-like phosphodiesterase 3a isoform X2 n=1 Tax=Pseudophryne corroboree TaxID=495146 RepID=UPI003081C45C